MKVNLLSADRVVATVDASEVNVPGVLGYMGILEDHAPMIAEMGAGALEIKGAEGSKRYFVSGGFVEVTREDIRVLVDMIEAEQDIDFADASSQLSQCKREMETTPDWDGKAKLQKQISMLEAKLTLKQ